MGGKCFTIYLGVQKPCEMLLIVNCAIMNICFFRGIITVFSEFGS